MSIIPVDDMVLFCILNVPWLLSAPPFSAFEMIMLFNNSVKSNKNKQKSVDELKSELGFPNQKSGCIEILCNRIYGIDHSSTFLQ